MALSERRKCRNQENLQSKHLKEIETDYNEHGKYKMKKIISKNIMIIGRTRSGKSTIKSLLLNPTTVPKDLTLKSDTVNAFIESFYIEEKNATINIIDTPGLFERGSNDDVIRENELILQTIEKCANMEITRFNVICFCAALTAGINDEDVKSISLFMKSLGDEVSSNSCLIVTHCESKNEAQRKALEKELEEDKFFKTIKPYFKLGVFFSGAINRDNYNNGNECILDEYVAISEYRAKLIDLFVSDVKPFPITETRISEIRHANQAKTDALHQLQNEQNVSIQQKKTNVDLQRVVSEKQKSIEYLKDECNTKARTVEELQEANWKYKYAINDLEKKSSEQSYHIRLLEKEIQETRRMANSLLESCSQQQIQQLKQKYPNYFLGK